MTARPFPRYVRRRHMVFSVVDAGYPPTRRQRKAIARSARLLANRYAISRVYVLAVARKLDIERSTAAERKRLSEKP